jgi:hypothetical protein
MFVTLEKINQLKTKKELAMKIKTVITILFFISIAGAVFGQKPIGITKNATASASELRITAGDPLWAGSTGGSIFIDNFPNVQLSHTNDYWVVGEILMEQSSDWLESGIPASIQNDPCGHSPFFFHSPIIAPDSNRSQHYRAFFQLLSSDIGGYWNTNTQANSQYRLFFRRFIDNNYNQEFAWSDEIHFPANTTIKFVMVFAKISTSDLGSTPANGSFLAYRITGSGIVWPTITAPFKGYFSNLGTIDNTCTRIFLGSCSHGNLQNSEPSVHLWHARINVGDITCADLDPHNQNPLMGKIMKFAMGQSVLNRAQAQPFFDNTGTIPTNSRKFVFPGDIPSNYQVVIPWSHWEEDSNSGVGRTYWKEFWDVPTANGGKRLGLITNTNAGINYCINYWLYNRHELKDRKFGTVSFFIGNSYYYNENTNRLVYAPVAPEFWFYTYVRVKDIGGNYKDIYIKFVPGTTAYSYYDPYLSVPFSLTNTSCFQPIVLNLQYILGEAFGQIGFRYHFLVEIKALICRGRFALADLILSSPISLSKPSVKIEENEADPQVLPGHFTLAVHPNPFNSSTLLSYSINEQGIYNLIIYDLLGRKVKTLLDQISLEPGNYQIIWDGRGNQGSGLPSSTYLCVLTNGLQRVTKKIAYIK